AGQHVGRELDARERAVERVGERADDQRLGEPGDPLEQDVAAGDEAEQEAAQHLGLTDQDLADLGLEIGEASLELGDIFGEAIRHGFPGGGWWAPGPGALSPTRPPRGIPGCDTRATSQATPAERAAPGKRANLHAHAPARRLNYALACEPPSSSSRPRS